jgi:peptide chain release factor 1
MLCAACQIRAGTGGEEAALFAADLLRMYQRYAETQKWKVSQISQSPAENGGLKEVIVEVGHE